MQTLRYMHDADGKTGDDILEKIFTEIVSLHDADEREDLVHHLTTTAAATFYFPTTFPGIGIKFTHENISAMKIAPPFIGVSL